MPTPEIRRNCDAYARWVFEQTSGSTYDLIVTSERQFATVPSHTWAGTMRAATRGYRSYVGRWVASGARVVVIEDVRAPSAVVRRVPSCLSTRGRTLADCSWPAHEDPHDDATYRWMDPLSQAVRDLANPHAAVVSMNDLLCPSGTCLPVIGGVLTYFDASHLTATYAKTLAPALATRIAHALSAD